MSDRKILFRGFHPDENGKTVITLTSGKIRGRWVYWNKFGVIVDPATMEKAFYPNSYCDMVANMFIYDSTIGQWVTTDKNGKDVFEGDKIKAHYVNTAKGKETHIQIVVYKGMAFMAKAEDIGFYSQLYDGVPHFPFDKSVYMDEFEVIGNKWEVRG